MICDVNPNLTKDVQLTLIKLDVFQKILIQKINKHSQLLKHKTKQHWVSTPFCAQTNIFFLVASIYL